MTRIIYLDIDGTLRDEVRGVTPQTAQALEQCQARGIYIVLCTGRNPASIQPDVRRLPTDGLIAGGRLLCPRPGQHAAPGPFPARDCRGRPAPGRAGWDRSCDGDRGQHFHEQKCSPVLHAGL